MCVYMKKRGENGGGKKLSEWARGSRKSDPHSKKAIEKGLTFLIFILGLNEKYLWVPDPVTHARVHVSVILSAAVCACVGIMYAQ